MIRPPFAIPSAPAEKFNIDIVKYQSIFVKVVFEGRRNTMDGLAQSRVDEATLHKVSS
jgi:hypothetical protein